MANYLNKPLASEIKNNYVSQFVPLPLELFARANERDQKEQDSFTAQTEAVNDGLWKINPVDANDKQYTDQFKQGFADAASQLVNTNLTQRENQDKVKKLIKDTGRDKDLQHIMTVSSQYQTWKENVAKAKEAGTYTRENDMGEASFANYGKAGGYKSGLGIDPTVIKYSAERPVMETFFNDVGDDGGDIMKQVGQTYYNDGFKGITAGKINSRALAAYQGYAATPEAAQGMRRFALLDPKTQAKFKGGAEEYVFKQFLDAGLERVHQTTSSGRASALNDDRKEAKTDKKEKEEKINLFNGMSANEIPSTILDGMDVKFENGKIKGDGKGAFANIREAVAAGNYNPVDIYNKISGDNRISDEQTTRLHSVIAGAALSGVSEEKYAQHFSKSWAPVIDKVLVGSSIKANNDAFMNGGAGVWSNMIISKDGKGAMPLLEALRKSFGTVPDPAKDAKGFKEFLKNNDIQVGGSFAPNRLSARSIAITVNGITFAGDMTGGGKNLNGVTADDQKAHVIAKLNSGEQYTEIDKKTGDTILYYKDLSKWDPDTNDYRVSHKIIPKK